MTVFEKQRARVRQTALHKLLIVTSTVDYCIKTSRGICIKAAAESEWLCHQVLYQ